MPGIWEKRDIAHTEEVCKALVRIPVIKHGQIAQLVGIREEQAFRLVRHAYDSLARREYVKEKHRSGRYNGGRGMRYYVRLTRDAAREWGEREGIQPRNIVRSIDLIRYIATMDILVALRTSGLLYDEWDMTLPQEEGTPFHTLLRHKQSGYQLGVYLLPHKYVGDTARKKLAVIRGTIRQVDQKAKVDGVLYLIPRAYYSEALRMVLKLDLISKSSFLLPLESFLERPRYYLWGIRLGEKWYMEQLLEAFQPQEILPRPLQFNYAVLAKFDERVYRFLDTYVAGDIERLRFWIKSSHTTAFQIPGTGSAAAASVYVYDNTVQKALVAASQDGKKNSVTAFLPWPIDEDENRS